MHFYKILTEHCSTQEKNFSLNDLKAIWNKQTTEPLLNTVLQLL